MSHLNTPLNFELLKKLRANFLSESPSTTPDYWTPESLVQYDATFGQRIAWKWEAVLAELADLGFLQSLAPTLYDWGCGTGIASRALLKTTPMTSVLLSDRSELALQFAKTKVQELVPEIIFKQAIDGPYTLLISHVLNELPAHSLRQLEIVISQAQSVIWVEPGTHDLSRRLIAQREKWREQFDCIAPCPHQAACGLLAKENAKDWCHHFAPSPSLVFQSGEWQKFSKELKIDLRSLPVSYLVLQKRQASDEARAPRSPRVIGRPRNYTGYSLALVCRPEGVKEEKVLKKETPALLRAFKEGGFVLNR